MIEPAVRERVVALLRGGLTAGLASLSDYEAAVGAALAAETETELSDLVRKYAPPVRMTPPERRYAEPLEVSSVGMFNDIKLKGRWQVPRELRVSTGPSTILLDFTDAQFDDWTIDVDARAAQSWIVVKVPRGFSVQLISMSGKVNNRLDDPIPGYPVIRLRALVGFGSLALKHPRESRRQNKARKTR